MNFIVIIPARFYSKRLPGKPLINIHGKPMIIHVMEKAIISGAEQVIIATDHHDIVKVIESVGGQACLTRSDHQSGTERLEEVVSRYNYSDDTIIVNVQCDEPLIPPEIIYQVANNLYTSNENMATLAVPIFTKEEACDTNTVKVVFNVHGYALYFSRACIPWNNKNISFNIKGINNNFIFRHIGIYSYRVGFLRRYVRWPISPLEKIETLEQLRVLWYGERIHVEIANIIPERSINIPEDLDYIRTLLKG